MSSEQKSNVRRILLKISGEALSGDTGFGIDPAVLSQTAKAIREVQKKGVQTVLVIGGGNIFRGAALQKAGFDIITGNSNKFNISAPMTGRKRGGKQNLLDTSF